MKRILFLVGGLLVIAAASIVVIRINSIKAESQTVDAREGQEFFLNTSIGRDIIINLEANPTTGYSWKEEYDNSFLKLTNAEYTSTINATGLVGSGGIQTYRFKALRLGQTSMTLSYRRPWEDQDIDRKIFNIDIK